MRTARVALAIPVLIWALLAGTARADTPAAGWTIQQSPNPDGAAASVLNAVSCAGDGTCSAVGLSSVSNVDVTLAEHWDGSAWSIESTPNPRGATFNDLTGVSCAAPAMCIAVGFTISSGSKVRPLAILRSGSTWSLRAPPKPTTAFWAELSTVSCVTSADCTAVGGYIRRGADAQEQPLAEHWDGASWSIEKVPNPHTENGSSLNGVSCVSSAACEAAGSYVDFDVLQAVLAFGWDGSRWTRQTEPDPGGQEVSDQSSVSCSDASACSASGSWSDDRGVVRALIERWDGTGWTMQTAAEPVGSQNDRLAGVSCSISTACTAVGNWSPSATGSPQFTMAERWNGTDWAIQSTPTPPGSTQSSLNGVDCSTPGVCVAVGSTQVDGVSVTLVEVRAH